MRVVLRLTQGAACARPEQVKMYHLHGKFVAYFPRVNSPIEFQVFLHLVLCSCFCFEFRLKVALLRYLLDWSNDVPCKTRQVHLHVCL